MAFMRDTTVSILEFVAIGFLAINAISFLVALIAIPSLFRAFRSRDRGGTKGHVYAFTDWGQLLPVVKIGRAVDADQRLAAHKTAAPFGLLVFCVVAVRDDVLVERFLHDKYERWRISTRNEWFWLTPVMLYELILMRLLFRSRQ